MPTEASGRTLCNICARSCPTVAPSPAHSIESRSPKPRRSIGRSRRCSAKAVSAKSYDFDQDGNETTIDYARMLQVVKDAGYTGYIGVEYEGNNLSEQEGIEATRDLLISVGSEMN